MPEVLLDTVKPRDIAQIIKWSTQTRDSFFLMNSILPISSDDLAVELSDLSRQWHMVSDRLGKRIGALKVYNIQPGLQRALLSFTMHPSQNNTKLMQEAGEIILEKLFNRNTCSKVYTHCLPYELEYKKILSDLQFKKEGQYKEHLFINNTYYDLEIFAVTKEDYFK